MSSGGAQLARISQAVSQAVRSRHRDAAADERVLSRRRRVAARRHRPDQARSGGRGLARCAVDGRVCVRDRVHPDRVARVDLRRRASRRVRPALGPIRPPDDAVAGVLPEPPDRRCDVPVDERRPDRARDVGRRPPQPRERGDRVPHRADDHGVPRSDRHAVGDPAVPADLLHRPSSQPADLSNEPRGPGRARDVVGAPAGRPRRDPGDQDVRARGPAAHRVCRALAQVAGREHGGGEGPDPDGPDADHARVARHRDPDPGRRPGVDRVHRRWQGHEPRRGHRSSDVHRAARVADAHARLSCSRSSSADAPRGAG